MLWRDGITSDEGPYKALISRGDFIDKARNNRAVPYKIYYPDCARDSSFKPLPLIVWSHGFGGNRDGAAFLSRFIASQGYVLLHVTHPGTDSSLWEGKAGHPWDILRKTNVPRAVTIDRFLDISFALGEAQRGALENPAFEGLIDFDNVGISGHSFGALTTQVIAGQLFPDEDESLISYGDPRFKAGIVYSPAPIEHLLSKKAAKNVYGSISIPLFYMTGTDDEAPIGGFNYERRLRVYEETGHPERYLKILKGGDHMVYNGTRGKLAANPLRDKHEELIKMMSLAFWDARLKDCPKAHDWLADPAAQAYLGEHARFAYGR